MMLTGSFCLFVVATLYGVCQAQCVIRTLMPMTMLDTCGGCGITIDEPQSSSSCTVDDLSALLMLVRALEMDRAASVNHGIDVNGLLNTLVHALVYTATHNCGGGGSPPPSPPPKPSPPKCDSSSNCSGHPPKGSPPGSGSHPTPGSTHNHGKKDGSHHSHGKKDEDDPLIDLNLLGGDDPNVLDLDIVGKGILDVGLGDTSSGHGKGKGGGVVTGLLDSLL